MLEAKPPPIVLGSQSPQRRELLGRLLGDNRWSVVTPQSTAEEPFAVGLSLAEIDDQLLRIARWKLDDVASQLAGMTPRPVVVTADTVIVGLSETGPPVVLGKPPVEDGALRATVREWFERYYAGRRHLAKTGLCVGIAGATPRVAVVTTEVWFRRDAGELIDWYLDSGEPRGKAGGYAIQDLGSLFVERLTGSLSNVVGLPLLETLQLIRQVADESRETHSL